MPPRSVPGPTARRRARGRRRARRARLRRTSSGAIGGASCWSEASASAHGFGHAVVEVARHLAELHERALHVAERLGDLGGGAESGTRPRAPRAPIVGRGGEPGPVDGVRGARAGADGGELRVPPDEAGRGQRRRRCGVAARAIATGSRPGPRADRQVPDPHGDRSLASHPAAGRRHGPCRNGRLAVPGGLLRRLHRPVAPRDLADRLVDRADAVDGVRGAT